MQYSTVSDTLKIYYLVLQLLLHTYYIFQRALRLADAKAVEAKAARIKDWVTNKLRELEDQNAHLKVQNAKANDQMELLRNRLEQLQVLGASTKSRQSSMVEVNILKIITLFRYSVRNLVRYISFKFDKTSKSVRHATILFPIKKCIRTRLIF